MLVSSQSSVLRIRINKAVTRILSMSNREGRNQNQVQFLWLIADLQKRSKVWQVNLQVICSNAKKDTIDEGNFHIFAQSSDYIVRQLDLEGSVLQFAPLYLHPLFIQVIYYQLMEPQSSPKDVFFCLSPFCPSPNTRIYFRSKAEQHKACQGWSVLQRTILTYNRTSLQFNPNKQLPFASKPLQAQAYIYLYSGALRDVGKGLVASLRRSISRQIDMFEDKLTTLIEEICSFSGYQKIVLLAEQSKSSVHNRSLLLQAALGKGLPTWEDFSLPSYEQIKILVRKLEDNLSGLLNIKTRSKCTKVEEVDLDGTYAEEQSEKEEKHVKLYKQQKLQKLEKLQKLSKKLMLANVETIKSTMTMKKNKEIKQMKLENKPTTIQDQYMPGEKEMQNYARATRSLFTAEALMGQCLPSFFKSNPETKQTQWFCHHCPHRSSFKCESKAAGRAKAAHEIIEHLIDCHRFISSYNYLHKITKRAIEEISVPELINLAQAPHIRKVYLIDRSSSFFFQHILNDLEPSLAVEIVPYWQKSHSSCEYISRKGMEQILLLLGLAIYAVGVRMGKSLVVYCGNEGRAKMIEEMCTQLGVQVKVVIGKGKRVTRIQQNVDMNNMTVKMVKLEQ